MPVVKVKSRVNKTALSYWFPKLLAAGLPVPKTEIFKMPLPAQKLIWKAFDGEQGTEEEGACSHDFVVELSRAVNRMGVPAFLRTDHTSCKHEWERTCYLDSSDTKVVASHVFAIAEGSELAAMGGGLTWDTWAVREYLPVKPLGTCPNYGGMPLITEWRFFVEDDKVRCFHPYWPIDAIKRGGADPDLYSALCTGSEDQHLHELARAAGAAVGGAWSVDLLDTEKGWYVTDMAEAHKSYHWPDCEHASK